MDYSEIQKTRLRRLPKVDELMNGLPAEAPHATKLRACRETVAALREAILSGAPGAERMLEPEAVRARAEARLEAHLKPSLQPVVNATGVVIHTNLGRSPLPPEILDAMMEIASRYSNLEYNLESGLRGSRYSHVEDLLCELTGAEAALVVNNNAAAVLITLETLAKGREVVVSRGELVEIGGSFRIPDVMARSGALLKEVGATNRTHLFDYESAIGPETALLLKVHQSNFQVVGFTKAVPIAELAGLAHDRGLPVFEDLGSGTLVDFAHYGMVHEPTVQESVAAGADLVSFSGDKLLGGPQAGIIVGRRAFVDRIKKNPLNRAIRIDKLTLVALEGILRLYRDPHKAVETIPTLRMLTEKPETLRRRAKGLARGLSRLALPGLSVETVETVSRVGGGALPLARLRSFAVSVQSPGVSTTRIEEALRANTPPIITRIETDRILLDIRTIANRDIPIIEEGFKTAWRRLTSTTPTTS